jgi:drug/metabolite transporter (DMT)-like permease
MGACAMVLLGASIAVSQELVDVPVFLVQAIRYSIAVPVLLMLATLAHAPIVRPRGREWWWLAGVAAMGLVLFNVAVVRGVAHAEPAVIAVAVACVPVLLGVIEPLARRSSPRRRVLLAAVVVTAGSVLVLGLGRTDALGVMWAVLALASEAAFTLLAMPVLPRHGAWGVSLHAVWMAAVMLIVLSLITEKPTSITRLTTADWAAIAYLAVMVTAVTFVLWYSAVATLGAGQVGLLTGISPISAAVAGIVTADQLPRPVAWLGIFIVVSGLALGLWSPSKPGSDSQPTTNG